MTSIVPSSRASIPVQVWASLPTACKDKVKLLKNLVLRCQGLPHGKRREQFAQIAASAGIGADGNALVDAETLRKRLYAFEREGELALIDHKLCAGLCAQPTCKNTRRISALPQALIDEWMRKMLAIRSVNRTMKETRTMRQAWREIIAALIAGESLPGAGTWREVRAAQRPTQRVPVVCPYSERCPPDGWSYQNFILRKPSQAVIVAAQRGIGALQPMLYQVRMDYSTLRPQELLIIDDKRLDVIVHGRFEGVVQLCELWALMIMDACTRRIVWVQLHPKFKRQDGTTVGIQRRDVQHAFAHYLSVYGLPVDYPTTLWKENASATFDTSVEELFTRITQGRVKFHNSGLFIGNTQVHGFTEKGGNPRGKAALESYFGHRFDVAFGAVKGQIGSNYLVKPGDVVGRLNAGREMLRTLGDAATDAELKIVLPFESLHSVRPLVMRALHEIETRNDHELEGFDAVTKWRLDESSNDWKTMLDPKMQQLVASRGMEWVNAMILSDPTLCVQQRETPREKWDRLRDPANFESLSHAAFVDAFLDQSEVRYTGNGQSFAKIGERRFDFVGRMHSAQAGAVIHLRFDADRPEQGAVLQDLRGSYLGRMEWDGRHTFGDEEALLRQLGERKKSEAEYLREVRKITQPRDVVIEQIAQLDERNSVLSTFVLRGREAVATAESESIAASIEGDEGRALRAAMPAPADTEDVASVEERRRAMIRRKQQLVS